jgi:serine/threonine-protein kinase RsbW
MMNPYVFVTVPAKAEYLDILRLTLYGFATKLGFSFEEIEDMKVAVAEACNNAILHAYGEDESGTIELRLESGGDRLIISVRDHGQSFSYSEEANQAIALDQNDISEVSVGGLGLFLMEALMDDVQVTTESGSGTEIVLTKRLVRNGGIA